MPPANFFFSILRLDWGKWLRPSVLVGGWLGCVLLPVAAWGAASAEAGALGAAAVLPAWLPWWGVLVGMFCFTALLGVVGALAGVGGGVLFVPLVGGFLPFFHLDYVRGTALVIALSGALAGGPKILGSHLVHFRVVLPCAVLASLGAVFGAWVGLRMNPQHVLGYLGVLMLGVAAMMLTAHSKAAPTIDGVFGLVRWFKLGQRQFSAEDKTYALCVPQRLVWGWGLFLWIGFIAGVFGTGAGWANTPAFNLVLQLPLRTAVATSYFMLTIVNSTAALVYLGKGAVSPWLVGPAVLGMMLGARLGVRLMTVAPLKLIRLVTVGLMLVAGLRALSKGFGW